MKPAQQIALWADRLRDISAMGFRFSDSIHALDNYRQLQQMAQEMLALATGKKLDHVEPLVAPLRNRPTPFSVGEAAIIDESGRILLIRRADNGKWAMPGGVLAVGETPAAGAVREAFEETGMRCRPISLVGVFDSLIAGSETPHHLYRIVFLCTPSGSKHPAGNATHAVEVLDAKWFEMDALPEAYRNRTCVANTRGIPGMAWR